PAPHPDLGGLDPGLVLLGPHERLQVGRGLVADLVEPLLLGGAVERLPGDAVAPRPLLAGTGLATDLVGDHFPRVPDRPHLGGDGERGLQIATHDLPPAKWLAGRPKVRDALSAADAGGARGVSEGAAGSALAHASGSAGFDSRLRGEVLPNS